MEKKVKQHTIPRFYLKWFADGDGLIYVYDVSRNREYESNYESVAYINNAYETEWEIDNPQLGKYILQNDIENILSGYEKEFSDLLYSLEKRIFLDQNQNALICCSEEKNILMRLAINLYLRQPETINAFEKVILNNVLMIEEVKQFVEQLALRQVDCGKAIARKAVKKAIVTEEIDGGVAGKLIELIENKPFMFVYNASGQFFICDRPVAIGVDRKIAGDDKNCLFLPLSPYSAVLFGNYENMKRNHMIIIDDQIASELVDQYVRNGIEGQQGRIYFRSKEQRSVIVSKIKENHYAGIH